MTKKPFNELTEAGKTRRLNAYKKEVAKRGNESGLFIVTAVKEHENKVVAAGKKLAGTPVKSTGFYMAPAGSENNSEGLADSAFKWYEDYLPLTSVAKEKILPTRLAMIQTLKDKNVKSLTVAVEYHIADNGARYIASMYVRGDKSKKVIKAHVANH